MGLIDLQPPGMMVSPFPLLFFFLDNIYEGNYSRDHDAEKTVGKNLNITRWYKGLKVKNPSLNLHLNLLTIELVIAYIVMTVQGGRFPLINWKFSTNIAPNVISSLHFFKRERINTRAFIHITSQSQIWNYCTMELLNFLIFTCILTLQVSYLKLS